MCEGVFSIYEKESMSLLSKPGHSSTTFEKFALLGMLLGGCGIASILLMQQAARHHVFEAATPVVYTRCVSESNYNPYRVWSTGRQELYDCIVRSGDVPFKEAAAKYIGKRSVIKYEDEQALSKP